MIRPIHYLFFFFLICQDFPAMAQSAMLDNFTDYVFPYRNNFAKYGEEDIIRLSSNKYHLTPSPTLPGLRIHQIQDSLCSVYKVKQSIYSVKVKLKKGYTSLDYVSNYDEKGRLISYTTPEFSQVYTYYEDSIIEQTTVRIGKKNANIVEDFERLHGTYDKNKNLVKVVLDDSVLVLNRKYENGLLIQSSQVDHFGFTMGYKHDRKPQYLEMKTYDLSYYPETSILKSIIPYDSLVYSKEYPNQLESVNGLNLIYNMKGKLIEYNLGDVPIPALYGSGNQGYTPHNYKYNYHPDGNLKSIVRTGGFEFYSNYVYDTKGRLTGMNGHLGNTSFTYLENGLISEMGGLKVEYTYY